MRGQTTPEVEVDTILEENWIKWEEKDFSRLSILLPALNKEKDKLLLTYLAVYGKNNVQTYAMRKLGSSETPALPVNPDDPHDDGYAPYLVLREQVMRESDYWVLKKAAFHAPKPMSRFAFCRLTGCSWIPEEDQAYSYRTYSCGLKRDVSREDIEDLCREMINEKAEGGRLTPDLTPERIEETAWNVCEHSPQHSYFLHMAYWYGYETEENDDLALQMLLDAGQKGHLVSYANIVKIYSEGEYVHKNIRLALTWQEKKVERFRELYEQKGTEKARRDYKEVLIQLGDMLMKEGYAKRAKRSYRMADQL